MSGAVVEDVELVTQLESVVVLLLLSGSCGAATVNLSRRGCQLLHWSLVFLAYLHRLVLMHLRLLR